MIAPSRLLKSCATPPAPQKRLPGNRQRVLLVEDDAALRALTRRMLTSNGYEVVDASDGEEALARWSEQAPGEPFDAVITDVVMPDMGGRELVSRLRRMATSIRVLYVSGYLGDEVSDLDLSGATALVPKPFAGDALLAQLRTLMMRS
jgi:CheY-like chemotaxis protein